MNSNQKKLKQMIREEETSIPDQEFFTSSAFHRYLTSQARAATGRYCYGLQALISWDESEDAALAYTDSYKIYLNAANHVTQSFPSRFLRALSLVGMTGHETAHLLYTDFTTRNLYLRNLGNGTFYPEDPSVELSAYQKSQTEIMDALQEKDKAVSLTLRTCAASLQNILEDVYIEARMCAAFPGSFRKGIQLNNLRMVEQIPDLHEQLSRNYQPFTIATNLLLAYCRSGTISNRFQSDSEYLDVLTEGMEYIDTALEAPSIKERLTATNCLLVLFWDFIKPLVEEMREKLEQKNETEAAKELQDLLDQQIAGGTPIPLGKDGAEVKNIPSAKGGAGTDPQDADFFSSKGREEQLKETEKVMAEEGGRLALAKTSAILDGNDPGVTYAPQYAGTGYEDAAADIARVLKEAAAEKAQEAYEQQLSEELQKAANEIHYGNAHAGIHVTIHRIQEISDHLIRQYEEISPPLLRASKRLQSTILPLLKEEAEGGKQKNLLYGRRLDMRSFHHQDGSFFIRTRLPADEQRLAVGLLIDESGSMGWGDRITHARKTAIVLYDFCVSLGIPVTIYGHSTDSRGVALYSYAEFDSVDEKDRYRLMDMIDRNGNRDGAALRFVAEHLAQRPEKRKLLILISDGQPADDGYYGTEAEADLRGIKQEYARQNIILFAAAIGEDKDAIQRIYQEGFLDITRLDDLPKNLTILIKQYLR
ncbi:MULTISPECIES: nitric oxide reductase activation protein NorD [unclassified Eubacterium (in: firmicutes)]|uniref:nitric oxide reductase activation protein NorD n=1 Tax=unclassified Eubacterium (in: firmicutes) TaxID=2624479 RepID=UPI00194E7C13|nr:MULTISPECIES: nitric oxide reductase activation protein NorD [unclassified Eubacterium (in: firmicutes)]